MSASYDRGNFGDSCRNRLKDIKKPNVDEAGEHAHSDTESTSSTNSSKRYINPAICIEKVETSHSAGSLDVINVTPHPHTQRSNSTPFLSVRESLSSVRRISCNLDLDIGGSDEVESSLNGTTYREQGSDTFRLSVASISTTSTTKDDLERNEEKRQEAFKQWLVRKEQEKKEKARLEKLRQQQVNNKVITEEEREESYRRWLEQKRVEADRRKVEINMQQYRLNESLERQRLMRENAKQEKLADWVRKKEEEMKKMKTREERAAARVAIENEKRRVNGAKAYRDWLRTSKNKPLPVPLNQGELSMRGSVSDMYINPIPWKSLI